ncbi:hypothetical protein NAC44_17645 [Allorhizobium sp. BGMRC 0089]|uniref:hypothetical protein n=1 Tax=Allorhizobium sonneratiae TaxID=2934936 RepID=UPI002033D4A7|nr:hypothetical protein [Allorhizobium sonneratiae]MCM2294154.1 hypothetical protein [Allorhizobium sonneratiae]
MNDENKRMAFTSMIKVMQHEAQELIDRINIAAADMEEQRCNSAVGALCTVDESLERIATLLSSVRAIHRMPAF